MCFLFLFLLLAQLIFPCNEAFFKQVCDSQNKCLFADTWFPIIWLVHQDIANVWQLLEFVSLWCLNKSPLRWQMVQFGFLFMLKLPTCPTFQQSLKHFNFQIIPFYIVNHIPCLKFPALYPTFVTFSLEPIICFYMIVSKDR